MSLNTKTRKITIKTYKHGLKQQKHKNIHKNVISKPILIYIQPKYYSNATIDFNYFYQIKPNLLIN